MAHIKLKFFKMILAMKQLYDCTEISFNLNHNYIIQNYNYKLINKVENNKFKLKNLNEFCLIG